MDPVLQGAAGLGIYLQEAATMTATEFFDTNRSFNDVTDVCTGDRPVCRDNLPPAVPTLSRFGSVALLLVLALGGVAVLVARRRT